MTGIDRKTLVSRHNPCQVGWDPNSPLSVGNGDFAFTTDFTGLQTCVDTPRGGVPRCTMSQWGFHSYPEALQLGQQTRLREWPVGGRTVGYLSDASGQEAVFNSLRVNPHRFNLGNIGLYIEGCPSDEALMRRVGRLEQKLDVWTGLLTSNFDLDGIPLSIQTVCHPTMPLVAFRIIASCAEMGKLGFNLRFPYASHTIDGSDWTCEEAHESNLEMTGEHTYGVSRTMDTTQYWVHIDFPPGQTISMIRNGRHHWTFRTSGTVLEASVLYTPTPTFTPTLGPGRLPSFEETRLVSAQWWERLWMDSAAVSFEGSDDPRAGELERRVVLSQYLTAIQCLGSLPPAETGLTCNSWYGKFHLEMHVWHAAQAVLWNRVALLERSLGYYQHILPQARRIAEQQGYAGVRWPKMTDSSGVDSPSTIGGYLCWQQPHPIYFAELLYRKNPSAAILNRFAELVFESAVFMADYAQWDEVYNRYILGPPVIPAQENHAPEDTLNPLFELEYWRWGLKVACEWKRRLNQTVPEKWLAVLSQLSQVPRDGRKPRYAAHERCADTYGAFATDHPSFLFAYGFLPPQTVEPELIANSVDGVMAHWHFDTLWGWDFPGMAMTLARLGRRKAAVDMLLAESPKNTYLPNGHNRQETEEALPLYLPGNGGLLLAVAMMAAGWDGCEGHAPGFPGDGSWQVQHEGLERYL